MEKARRLSHNISYNHGIRWTVLDGIGQVDGGGGGIRTHGTRKGTPVFETGTFDHSVTPPGS